MGSILEVNWLLLAAAAAPGMLFTAVTAGLLYLPGKKFLRRLPLLHLYLTRQGSDRP